MRSVANSIAVAALLASVAYPALGVEIPLSGLQGTYEMEPDVPPDLGAPSERSMDFHLPGGSATGAEAFLVISGEWNAGEVTCDLGGGIDQVYPHLPSLIIELSSVAFPDLLVWGELMSMPDVEFSNVAVELSPGVEQFLGAEVHARLMVSSLIVGMCSVTLDPYGTLSDVRLLIDGVVPVEGATWSAIKQRYD